MFTAFLIAAGILFLFLFVIWNGKNSFFNLFLKVLFGAMAAWSLVCLILYIRGN